MACTEKLKISSIRHSTPETSYLLLESTNDKSLGQSITIMGKYAYTSALALSDSLGQLPFKNIFMTIADFMKKSGIRIEKINLIPDENTRFWNAETHVSYNGKASLIDASPIDALVMYQLTDKSPGIYTDPNYLIELDKLLVPSPPQILQESPFGTVFKFSMPKPVKQIKKLDTENILKIFSKYKKEQVSLDTKVESEEQALYFFSPPDIPCGNVLIKNIMTFKSNDYKRLPALLDPTQAEIFSIDYERNRKDENGTAWPNTYEFLSSLMKLSKYKFTKIESGYALLENDPFLFSLQVDAVVEGAEKATTEISLQDLSILRNKCRGSVDCNLMMPYSLAEKFDFKYKKQEELEKIGKKELSDGVFVKIEPRGYNEPSSYI